MRRPVSYTHLDSEYEAFDTYCKLYPTAATPVSYTHLNIPEEKSVLLQHMILSHHGEPEFGAAVKPCCAEAELLSYIDLLDSRMEIYEMCIRDRLIDMANAAVTATKGCVICVEKGNKLIHEIKYQARLVDVDEYAIDDARSLYGLSLIHI